MMEGSGINVISVKQYYSHDYTSPLNPHLCGCTAKKQFSIVSWTDFARTK